MWSVRRQTLRSSEFSAIVTLVLALGIGAAAVTFSIVYTVLEPTTFETPVPRADSLEWKQSSPCFQSVDQVEET